MGSFVRLILGVPVGVGVTVLLFLFMAAMIKQDVRLDEEKAAVNIDITAKIEDTDLANQANNIKRPTLDAPPPPPPAVNDPSNRPNLEGAAVEIPQIDANLSVGSGFNPDRDAQPLVRIQDAYPERCMARAKNSESVTVQFDVTPEGTTTNVQVIDSTNRCFDRTVIRSVGRWKYQPKIVDNQPQWRRGVVTTITYVLEDG